MRGFLRLMEFNEIVSNYYGKRVEVIDIDDAEFVGLFSQYEYSTDNEEDQDIIMLSIANYYIEIPYDEIKSIKLA